MRPDETLPEIIADNEQCGRETEAVIAGIVGIADPCRCGRTCRGSRRTWSRGEVRWVLLHLIEELARHAGHADILREHIDGGTMYPIMAAAEHWPESPWMQPWQPTGDQVMP